MSNSKVAFARPKSATDDLGANTMPTGTWPPRNEYLVRFFAAPIKLDGRLGVEDSEPKEEAEDGLVYVRPAPDLPEIGDKLMCGIEKLVNNTPIVQWVAAECKSDSQVLVAGASECSDLPDQRWMLESEYESFTAAVALLSDADVKDDEELAVDLVKKARGETPQPRKPWGASRGSRITIGGASMIKRDFLVEESMGLHLNLKTLEVVRVDPKSQGSTVRVGWKVVEVNGEAVRNAYDLKVALAKLRQEAAAAGGGGVRASADEEHTPSYRRPHEMRWTFQVPASSSGLGNGPPILVLSAQVVRLCGKHDESCRLSCKHMPKLAFRLDPNAQYVDLLGRPIEAAPRYYPEGIEKMAMDSEGLFLPQNGHRIPQFGESLEAALAADVHIDTAKTTKFPSSVPSASPYVGTHGSYPDPLAKTIEERQRIHNDATNAVAARNRKSAERAEQERKVYEEHSVWASTELQTLKTTAIRDVEASSKAQINAARAEASHFRKQSLHYQQQLMETQRRSADPQTRMRLLPKPPNNSVVSTSSSSLSSRRPPPNTNEDIPPEPPSGDALRSSNENKNEYSSEVTPPPPPPKAAAQPRRPVERGWWDRMHGVHSERLEKRDKDHAEKVALEKEHDNWGPTQQTASVETYGIKTTRAAAMLATKVSAMNHLDREAAFMKKQEQLRPDNPLLRHSFEVTFGSSNHASIVAASSSSRVNSGGNNSRQDEDSDGNMVKEEGRSSKVCPACGFVPRFNATNPRGLKRGLQIEAQHSSSSKEKGNSGSGALFYRGTVLAVRTNGNCDIAYEEGPLKQETNVPPTLIRLPLKGGGNKGRCMCSTRKHLGYEVKKQPAATASQQLASTVERDGSSDHHINSSATSAMAGASSTDAAREEEAASSVAAFNSSSLYRGETTTLARTWQQTLDNLKQKESLELKAAHGGARREEILQGSSGRSAMTHSSIAPQAQAFVERQAAWDYDRYERAEETRRVQDAAATTPWHLNKTTRKRPQQAKKFSASTGTAAATIRPAADATSGASQETIPPPPPPPLFQSTFEPELEERSRVTSSPALEPPQPAPTRSKPPVQLPSMGSGGMAERWADQTKGRVVKQLCSQNHRFKRDAVRAVVASRWTAMEAKAAATQGGSGEAHVVAERSLAVSPMLSNWTVRERDDAIARLTAEALRDLHQQLPGPHWVGARVKVLPVKPPTRAGPGGSVIAPPQSAEDAASEGDAAKMGVVLSFDHAKQRFVVEIQATAAADGATLADGEGKEAQRKEGKLGLVTCDADRVVLVAKKGGPQAKLYSKTGEQNSKTSKELASSSSSSHYSSRWSTSRLDTLGANKRGPEKVYYVTNQSKGRLQALTTAKEAEAEAALKKKKRLMKLDKLRALLATTARATKALKAQIAAAVSAARAAKANPKEDPEVMRLEALLFDLLNKNVYTNLMRGTTAAASNSDDTMDLDAILASSKGGKGEDGGNKGILIKEETVAPAAAAPAAPAADTTPADAAGLVSVEAPAAESIDVEAAPAELATAETITAADTAGAAAEAASAKESVATAAEIVTNVAETVATTNAGDATGDNESYEYDQDYEDEEEEGGDGGGDKDKGGAELKSE